MKSYIKVIAPVILAVLVGTSLTFVFAQSKGGSNGNAPGTERGFGGRGDFGFGGLHPRLLDRLNLTAEQRTQITALQEAATAASETYLDQLQTIREQIRTAAQNGAFDEAQLRVLLRAKADIQIELEIIRLRTDAAIYNLLTAEQRTLLETLRQQHHNGGRGAGRN